MKLPLAEIKRLMELATPGKAEKYYVPRSYNRKSVMVRFGEGPHICEMVMHSLGRSDAKREENADLIVALHNAMPAIIERMEKLEKVAQAAQNLRIHVADEDGPRWEALDDALSSLDNDQEKRHRIIPQNYSDQAGQGVTK